MSVYMSIWSIVLCYLVYCLVLCQSSVLQQNGFAGLLIRGEVLVCEVLMQGVNVWKCVVKLMYGEDKATNYI